MPPYCLRARPMTECSNLKPDTRKPGAFSHRVMPEHVEVSRLRSAHRHGRGWAVVMFGFNAVYVGCHDHRKTSDAVVEFKRR